MLARRQEDDEFCRIQQSRIVHFSAVRDRLMEDAFTAG
jgi:hypothetical protein